MRLSAYEHLIPEKLFTNTLDPNRAQGVSAVKALALAANQGQKIYTLNVQNQTQHQTLLSQITIDPQAMAEIRNSLAAGKEVNVHQSPITQSGWTGSGYIITDPTTGAGAYKIVGGANGGMIFVTWLLFVAVGLAAAAVIASGAVVIGAIALVLLFANIFALIESIQHASNDQQLADAHKFAAFAAILSLGGLALRVAEFGLEFTSLLWIPASMVTIFRWAEFPPGWLSWLVN